MSIVDFQQRGGEAVLPLAGVSDSPEAAEQPIAWPQKYDTFGVQVSATTYAQVIDVLVQSAKLRRPTAVDFAPVSVIVEAARNPAFRAKLNSFELVCPDGQPIRWCLNHFHRACLPDTVCGTTTMLRICEAAAREQIGVYLYGSTPETLWKLQANLVSSYPRLQIVGAESPPFSALGPAELDAVVRRMNASGAGFVFVGIGSPKQESFVWQQKSRIRAVQLCVGAAFDFIAGTKKRAPRWMQKVCLEWLHRMCSEPSRLGKRYVLGNARFVALLLRALLNGDRFARHGRDAARP